MVMGGQFQILSDLCADVMIVRLVVGVAATGLLVCTVWWQTARPRPRPAPRPAPWHSSQHGLDFIAEWGEGGGVVGREEGRGPDQAPQDLGPACSRPVTLRQIGKS